MASVSCQSNVVLFKCKTKKQSVICLWIKATHKHSLILPFFFSIVPQSRRKIQLLCSCRSHAARKMLLEARNVTLHLIAALHTASTAYSWTGELLSIGTKMHHHINIWGKFWLKLQWTAWAVGCVQGIPEGHYQHLLKKVQTPLLKITKQARTQMSKFKALQVQSLPKMKLLPHRNTAAMSEHLKREEVTVPRPQNNKTAASVLFFVFFYMTVGFVWLLVGVQSLGDATAFSSVAFRTGNQQRLPRADANGWCGCNAFQSVCKSMVKDLENETTQIILALH